MAATTGIQWCDSTLNLQMGCDGCELWVPARGVRVCYAGVLTERQTEKGPRKGWPASFEEPTIFPERLEKGWPDLTGAVRAEKPWLSGLPRVVFLNDMGDTFTESLPRDWLAPYLPRLASSPHLYLLLTKRPKTAANFFRQYRAPRNLWVGVSITARANLRRIDELREVDAPLRFLSIEPQREWLGALDLTGIAWAILGGASGPEAWPYAEAWPLDLLEQCRRQEVAPFVKQLGSHYTVNGQRRLLRDSHGGDWSEWRSELRVRQMPRASAWSSPAPIGPLL